MKGDYIDDLGHLNNAITIVDCLKYGKSAQMPVV